MRMATRARLNTAAARDLLDRELPPVAPPVDCTDAEAFPNIAEASAWLAGLSPEERAEFEKEWM